MIVVDTNVLAYALLDGPDSGVARAALALDLLADAEWLLGARERQPDSGKVIDLAMVSGCTAYDCEFVALARESGALLVTADKQVLKAFPAIAISLADFVEAR